MIESYAAAGYISQYNERLAIALGLITLLFALATFATCRTCLALLGRLGWKNPTGSRAYRAFYRYHGYYWWGFWFVFLLHALVGTMHGLSVPESVDPDAYLHVPILWLGVGSRRRWIDRARIVPQPRAIHRHVQGQTDAVFTSLPLVLPVPFILLVADVARGRGPLRGRLLPRRNLAMIA